MARAVLAVGSAAAFAVAVGLAKVNNSGHSKRPLRPLAPSADYRATVHREVLTPGMIDPPVASPSAATHVS